ncbi:hypothetical protein E4T44_07866 [Aureobasidium sp. EXF-8845]|nr:hypothetical protein E4T44_07866 [Aureobasidium sp. EXF-8845]KAI4845240.1 hypothetical protein E4T45_07808 [Aureobasidium sp. EXF-8846]
MAIIPDVPHVIVDILVDKNPLPEYLDEDDDESVSSKSITKYVECVSGSKFAIRINLGSLPLLPEGGNSVHAACLLDGQPMKGKVLHRPWKNNGGVFVRNTNRYKEGGSWKERDFMFADLVTTENGPSSKPNPELKHLGTITIILHHSQAGQARASKARNFSSQINNVRQERVHEKDLKGQAISSQIKLGEVRSIGERTVCNVTNLGDAFATFNFRYRSRSEFSQRRYTSTILTLVEDLQALCLIPRTPSPVPLENRPEESLTREELLEVFRKQKSRREELVAIKQELKRERIKDESDDELMVVSSRPPTRKLKLSTDVRTGKESIDLTDD